MKLIVTGGTGFIGGNVITQALSHPKITSIVALSRKPIPEFDHNPKVTVVIMEDFLVYTDEVLEVLKGADACIWTIGAKAITDPVLTQTVTVDYAMAAAKAFATLNQDEGKHLFRFVHTSGRMSEHDRSKGLLLWAEARYVSGSIETLLQNFADQTPNFDVYVAKPAFVLADEKSVGNVIANTLLPSIRREVLVAGMLEMAVSGYDGERVLDNAELVRFGASVLAKQK